MENLTYQDIKGKGGPLSTPHNSRYLKHDETNRSAHGILRSGNSPERNKKNDVVLSNLTYKFSSDQPGRYHAVVEKSRDKNLNINEDTAGRFDRFADSIHSNRNHYMKQDTEEPIEDTYHNKYTSYVITNKENPYEITVDSKNLNLFPHSKNDPLSRKIDLVNNKLVKSEDLIIKKV
tara:strand:+ start:177 stop:707 length:531 start_codon:yes stop_codon:yes gene_type:complete